MNMPTSFIASKAFFDTKTFPYGFARSGEFTKRQATYLESFGHAYKQLDMGEREPESQEERDFVDFCRGLKPAETEHEKVWAIYRRNIGKKISYISMERCHIQSEWEDTASEPFDEAM
jgi:uncharacterized protein YifE (UPF0438 family)